MMAVFAFGRVRNKPLRRSPPTSRTQQGGGLSRQSLYGMPLPNQLSFSAKRPVESLRQVSRGPAFRLLDPAEQVAAVIDLRAKTCQGESLFKPHSPKFGSKAVTRREFWSQRSEPLCHRHPHQSRLAGRPRAGDERITLGEAAKFHSCATSTRCR